MRSSLFLRIAVTGLLGGSLLAARAVQAQKSNVVLQASISGTLGIAAVGPSLSQAGFQTDTFLTIVGLSPGTNRVLALSFDMLNTSTNISVLLWDKGNTGPVPFGEISMAESTVFLSRGDTFTFDTSLVVPSRFPNFAGGQLEIAGRGRLKNGKPTGVTATVRGILVDANPVDLGGTTGIVIRATLKTGAQLRELP